MGSERKIFQFLQSVQSVLRLCLGEAHGLILDVLSTVPTPPINSYDGIAYSYTIIMLTEFTKIYELLVSQAYAGRVRKDIDHRALKPAAWRVDDYLTLDEDEAADLDDLRGHTLTFTRNGNDAMARDMDKDDLVVRPIV